jgi:FeS assembly SUF system protein
MNLFKAFSSKSAEPEKPPVAPVDDAPLDVTALLRPAPPVEAVPAAPKPRGPLKPAMQAIHDNVIGTLKSCYDPEIPVNIYELGLVYDVEVNEQENDPLGESVADVVVRMTLTSPMCPVAGSLPGEVERKVGSVPHVISAKVDLVWEPAWNPNKMTEAAKLQLGML